MLGKRGARPVCPACRYRRTYLDDDLFEKMTRARTFQAGMQMVRQLEFALFDYRLHMEFATNRVASDTRLAQRGSRKGRCRPRRLTSIVSSIALPISLPAAMQPVTIAINGPKFYRLMPFPNSRKGVSLTKQTGNRIPAIDS